MMSMEKTGEMIVKADVISEVNVKEVKFFLFFFFFFSLLLLIEIQHFVFIMLFHVVKYRDKPERNVEYFSTVR